MGNVAIGTQSWYYPQWEGVFYDRASDSEEYLRMYAQEFSAVEVDTSFYGLPSTQTLEKWKAQTPPDFSFSLKAPRSITHELRFHNVTREMAEFCERVAVLGDKLGPVLFQLGPEADASLAEKVFAALSGKPPHMRFAFEFRHHSWFSREIFDRLEQLRVAVVAVDGPFMPLRYAQRIVERPTSDFHYLRILGVRGAVKQFDHLVFDRSADLKRWVDLLQAQPLPLAFVTTSNYYEGFAVETARRFAAAAGLPVQPRVLVEQPLPLDAPSEP